MIHSVFRSIGIFLKKFGEPLSGLIDRNCFSINRTSWIRFFKTWILTFSKVVQVFSLSPIQTWLPLRVLFFFFIFPFARFLSPNTGKTLLPLIFVFIFTFHAFLIWEFQTMHKLGFLMIQAKFCVIDHSVLLLYCYIHDLCWKIWTIWRFVKNQNF